MKTQYKFAIGISILLLLVVVWVAKSKMPNASSANAKNDTGEPGTLTNNEAQAREIFKRVMDKLPLGYVPREQYVVGGHIFGGLLKDELEQLWNLGYDLGTDPPAPGQSVSDKMGKGEVPILQKMTPEFHQCYIWNRSYSRCAMDLYQKMPGSGVGVAAFRGNLG